MYEQRHRKLNHEKQRSLIQFLCETIMPTTVLLQDTAVSKLYYHVKCYSYTDLFCLLPTVEPPSFNRQWLLCGFYCTIASWSSVCQEVNDHSWVSVTWNSVFKSYVGTSVSEHVVYKVKVQGVSLIGNCVKGVWLPHCLPSDKALRSQQ